MGKRAISLFNIDGIKNLSMELKLIYLYRYFSLLLTSVFYLIVVPGAASVFKPMVVVCLAVAAIILNNIYIKFQSDKILITLMIIIETISNVIILIPTGGLNSPYLWYSLNTVLISAYFFNTKNFCFNFMTYIGSLVSISYLFLNKPDEKFLTFLFNNSNLVLSFILIAFTIKSLMKMINKLTNERNRLTHTNKQLLKANKQIEESMEQIIALYQSVNNLINIKDEEKLIEIITQYTSDITKTSLAFAYVASNRDKYIFVSSEKLTETTKEVLFNNMKQNWNSRVSSEDFLGCKINDKEFTAVTIRSSVQMYGFLGIEINSDDRGTIRNENAYQLKFLASLSAILFERLRTEEMNKRLLISDEQNRIANEIHDSVSQRLFFISSKVCSLLKKNDDQDIRELRQELVLVKDALKLAMKELREVIYYYSSSNNEVSQFERNIKDYINEVSKLNEVNISYNIHGSQELIEYELKKVIYRIICEGIGNAIRHGKSKNVNVYFCIDRDRIVITINDDGIGFDTKNGMINKSPGLGLKNLHSLAYSYDGEISIDSQINKGTSIKINFPNKYFIKREKDKVV